MHAYAETPGRLVVLTGRLDASTVAEARAVLHAALDAGAGELVVDLREVGLLDATGLGMLVAAHRRAEGQQRRLVLSNVPPRITRLLQRTRLHRVLHVRREPAAVA